MTRTLTVSEKKNDILAYQEPIWKTADLLRGNITTKEHLYPSFMIPFFALAMVESRLIKEYIKVSQDTELLSEEDRVNEVKDNVGFYNSMVIEEKITIKYLVKTYTDNQSFYENFMKYLHSFDLELQKLLGIIGGSDTDNLNIETKIKQLKEKNILREWVAKWSEIDFTPYDNSEITTLEEHIKRRWTDMAAETAGQQYTPDDIIDLIGELILTCKHKFNKNKILKIYDMTCGGGNMLFGIEDKLLKAHPTLNIATYGQELEGALYSLAKIESKFRKDSSIELGNTLTSDKFPNDSFDFLVANPPYGVDWKDLKKDIDNDQTSRYSAGKPSTSDGQLLFAQHGISKLIDNLDDSGLGFIVFNGSPLFSGDAGSGESDIRKWILDNDYLETLVQLPTNEFFNTGITTYLWCLNKQKIESRKNKILCINAENLFEKLKKSKGDKTKSITIHNRKLIASIYENFIESDFSKVKSKYDFYFNKQSLKKLEKDEEFGSFNNGKDEIKLKDIHTITINKRNSEAIGFIRISTNVENNTKEYADSINTLIKEINIEEQKLSVMGSLGMYHLDENNCIIENKSGIEKNIGYGDIKVKAVYKKATNKTEEKVVIEVSLESIWTKDDEKIAYSPFEDENIKNIDKFLTKRVSLNKEEYQLLENKIGVEINFNNIFPKKIEIRSTAKILADIANIDKELGDI